MRSWKLLHECIAADNHSGDKIVLDALELMNSEGVSSLAVVDNQFNVMGNISTADVKVCYNFRTTASTY